MLYIHCTVQYNVLYIHCTVHCCSCAPSLHSKLLWYDLISFTSCVMQNTDSAIYLYKLKKVRNFFSSSPSPINFAFLQFFGARNKKMNTTVILGFYVSCVIYIIKCDDMQSLKTIFVTVNLWKWKGNVLSDSGSKVNKMGNHVFFP